MSEMIERVALAILNSDRRAAGLTPAKSRDEIPDSDGYVRNAIAVINEMRVPTEEMIVAMHDGAMGGFGEDMGDAQRQYVVDCWADMIVAAGADQ
jgi:hypothetical protein